MEQVTSLPCYSLISSSAPSSQKLSQTIRRAGGRKCGPGRGERKLCAGSGNVNLRSRDAEQHGASSKRVHKTELPVIRKPHSWVRTRRKRNRYLENSSPLRGHGSRFTIAGTWTRPRARGGRERPHTCARSARTGKEMLPLLPAQREGPKDTVRAGHSTARSHSHVGLEKVELRGPGLGGGLQGERRRSHATRFWLQNYYVPRI